MSKIAFVKDYKSAHGDDTDIHADQCDIVKIEENISPRTTIHVDINVTSQAQKPIGKETHRPKKTPHLYRGCVLKKNYNLTQRQEKLDKITTPINSNSTIKKIS